MRMQPSNAPTLPDPRLERALRRIVVIGASLVIAVPFARGDTVWLGSLPLWLLVMPMVSWWTLHRFRLPRFAKAQSPVARRRYRTTAQARRRAGSHRNPRVAHAA